METIMRYLFRTPGSILYSRNC